MCLSQRLELLDGVASDQIGHIFLSILKPWVEGEVELEPVLAGVAVALKLVLAVYDLSVLSVDGFSLGRGFIKKINFHKLDQLYLLEYGLN